MSKKGKSQPKRDYGQSLLGSLQPVDRPSALLFVLVNPSIPEDLKPLVGELRPMMADYIREQEEAHLEAIAYARGIAMEIKSPSIGLLGGQGASGEHSSFHLPVDWKERLLKSLARELYPRFDGKEPKGPGRNEDEIEYDLLEAVFKKVQAQKERGQKANYSDACDNLSRQPGTPWHGIKKKPLLERFNRARKKAFSPRDDLHFGQFYRYARTKLK